jgi:hypothetical protein
MQASSEIPGTDVSRLAQVRTFLAGAANQGLLMHFEGNIVASETEEEIFKILGKCQLLFVGVALMLNNSLGVPWQEPHERVRG